MSKLKEKREKAVFIIERASKEEAIELAIARVQIEKAFGKGSLIKMGESPVGKGIKSMSSG